ncbi:hypothetical protein P153DRAFT_355844 [Dothidotthia symphoricarpi CBS 119687]|uniref:Uncharacterized protein n=1 Tax=Dothidotthia symphoricarpi CBS 119687 TaxID=1392245 RepID=A0A6A6AGY6_9PLEO|nr:uncharacterized protein P153DRAFT_355844 [Dothidotthia symphoricarpi CBS 119687]KAF2131060.1 hypothetical protein P153DRAFT_355844 [Dothidotthia symphoricarpi CBS 119687]
MAPAANSSTFDLIDEYYKERTSGVEFIRSQSDSTELEEPIKDLNVDDDEKNKHEKAFLYTGGKEMPVHPAEENATGSITDQVAKDSSSSNASSHPMHDVDTGTTSGGSQHANAHKANPVWPSVTDAMRGMMSTDGRKGPVHADNLPTPANKEELKKRAEELNK